jgi:hypothetical protein
MLQTLTSLQRQLVSIALFFLAGTHHQLSRYSARQRKKGRVPMTMIGQLSVVTAYAAIAFVGAIVLGVL